MINRIKNGINNECKKLRINQVCAPQCVSTLQYKVRFKSKSSMDEEKKHCKEKQKK